MYRLGSQREKGYDHLFYLNFQCRVTLCMTMESSYPCHPKASLTLDFECQQEKRNLRNRGIRRKKDDFDARDNAHCPHLSPHFCR